MSHEFGNLDRIVERIGPDNAEVRGHGIECLHSTGK